MRRITAAIDIDAPAQAVWDLYADVPGSVEWDPPRRQVQLSTDKGMDARLVIEVEPLEPLDAGRSRVRQGAIFESRLPGPVGWVHELVFASVGRRGITSAVRAAKAYLEREARLTG